MSNNIEPFEIVPCICCWYDLLGFGAPLIEAKWSLKSKIAQKSVDRIKNLQGWLTGGASAVTMGTKLYMNDGIVASIDVEPADSSLHDTLSFLEAILHDYNILNNIDKRAQYPGIRGVITCGHRFCHDSSNMSQDLRSNHITAYYPAEFQMNTAFSKAFIVEGSGSKAGISGANMYIDKDLIFFFETYFNGCTIDIKHSDIEKEVRIEYLGQWFATLIVDAIPVKYANKGINTDFYRLKTFQAYYDQLAKEAAFLQAQKYAYMEMAEEI